MPSGPKKRRSAKKKTHETPDSATDPQVESNADIDLSSVEGEVSLAVKPSAAAALELTEPVGTVSSKEGVLVDNHVSSEEVVELSSRRRIDRKDMVECFCDVEGNESAEEGLDSGLKENDGKPVVEDSLSDQLDQLASGAMIIEGNDLASGTVLSDEDDSELFREAVEVDFSDDRSVNMDELENGKKLLVEAIDKVDGLRKSMEAQLHVAEAMVLSLQQLLAKWDLIRSTPTTTTTTTTTTTPI